jgi:putative mRNA 3-end processing factor
MAELLTVTPDGIYCPSGDFHVDPWRPVPRAVVTHAHADHAREGSARYLTSVTGAPLLRERLGAGARVEAVGWGDPIGIRGVTVSLHPAGHIRGAAQVRVEHRGEVWVVSGDYKLQSDPTAEPFEPVRCDVFISECTFGLPVFRWPDPAVVIDEIGAWWGDNRAAGRTSVLFAYSLGKAQRLLSGLETGDGPILAHAAVHRMTEVYREGGVALPPSSPATEEAVRAERGRALVLAPPAAAGSTWLRRMGPVSTAFASGWMRVRGHRRRLAADRGFVVSDHADWDGLLAAIDATGAERVELTHGTTAAMMRFLRERGLDARALRTPYEGEDAGEAAGEGRHEDDADPREDGASS